jgi:aminoglycoside 2''-phosphotransferase
MDETANARALIRRSIPGVAVQTLELLPHPGWGGDSDAWLVDDRWIFRIPRSTNTARRFAIEACLLPRLAPTLPLPIPAFQHIARDDRGEPSFGGYPRIPGQPLRGNQLRRLPRRRRARIATEIGQFLRALHVTSIETALACGVAPPNRGGREGLEDQLREIEATVCPALDDEERSWVRHCFDDAAAGPLRDEITPTLCHGDLSSDHILFDANGGELTGIIDFGDLTLGDPSGEFTWKAEYGEEFFHQVLLAYHPVDPTFPARVDFRIDCLPLIQIAYGVATGRQSEIEQGRHDLRTRMAASR